MNRVHLHRGRSLFVRRIAVRGLLVRPSAFRRARRDRSGARREVFEGRHCPGSREAALFDPDRSSRGRRDSRFHHRRQGILDHQRRAQLCYVHPAQAGIRSNLNLITASGHVYSFLLTEISNEPNAEPDLKIFVEPKEASGIAAKTGLAGYVSAGEAEAYKKELDALRAQTADRSTPPRPTSPNRSIAFAPTMPTKLQFDYAFDAKAAREPFLVSAIYHDDAFTYIKCAAREKPALYEIKDGKPNLIPSSSRTACTSPRRSSTPATSPSARRNCTFARHAAAN